MQSPTVIYLGHSDELNKRIMREEKIRKKNRLTVDADTKKKYNATQREYMKQKRADSQLCSLGSLIIKFHDIVSQGPVYICTCCNQLWYRHSVLHAAILKKSSPDIVKYFQMKEV